MEKTSKTHDNLSTKTTNPKPHQVELPQEDVQWMLSNPSAANIQQLQSLIGNQAVQRLLSTNKLDMRSSKPQKSAEKDFLQRDENEEEVMEFDPVYIEADPEFLPRAKRANQKYAQNPPTPGWPYRDDLKALWDANNYDEFAFRVQEFQIDVMNIPYDSKDADGILGKNTSRMMASHSSGNEASNEEEEAVVEPEQTSQIDTGDGGVPADFPQKIDGDLKQQVTDVASILAPVKDLYKKYEKLNKELRGSYTALSKEDDKIAAARWNIIQLTWFKEHVPSLEAEISKTEGELESDTLSKGDAKKKRSTLKSLKSKLEDAQKKLDALNKANDKKLFEDILKEAQEAREEKTPKKSDKPIMESYREKNPQRIVLEQQLVEAIKTARNAIGKLPNAELKKTAYLELNNYTPYHYQIENMDILYNSGDAGGRTCNVTSTAMVLQSLGKSSGDYNKSDVTRMNKIAQHFRDAIADRGADVNAESMPLPDFLQLVAVDLKLAGAEPTADAVSKARFESVDAILTTSFLSDIAKSFGAKTTSVANEYDDTLDLLGEVTTEAGNRSDTEEDRSKEKQAEKAGEYIALITVYELVKTQLDGIQSQVNEATTPSQFATLIQPFIDLIDEKTKELLQIKTNTTVKSGAGMLSSLVKQLKKLVSKMKSDDKKAAENMETAQAALNKTLANIEKSDVIKNAAIYKASGSYEDMETVLPIEKYKASFVPNVTKELEAGNQVVLNLYNHFVRLQSMEADGFVIDDPGRYKSESLKVTWEQGRADGYFRKYMIVKP